MRLTTFMLVLIVCAIPVDAAGVPAETKTTIAWEFEDDLEGWQPNAHMADVQVSGGVLSGHCTGRDPIMTQEGFSFPARPWQWIEVRMRSDRPGQAEFFWTNTTEGRYGGFTGQKKTPFHVTGDDQWHVYRIFPFWHPEGRIIKLRFDPFQGAHISVDYIRVMEMEWGEPASDKTSWEFEGAETGWWGARGVDDVAVQGGCMEARVAGSDPLLSAPHLDVSADDKLCVCLRMKSHRGRFGAVWWARADRHGLQRLDFPIVSDGRFHTYAIDMSRARLWGGRIVAFALSPSLARGADVSVDRVAISAEPAGTADLRRVRFGFLDAVNRAGKDRRVVLRVINRGGQPARYLRAILDLQGGATLKSPAEEHTDEKTHFGEIAEFEWTVRAERPCTAQATVQVTGEGLEPSTFRTDLRFTESPDVSPTDYVPEPDPVEDPYEIAAYYFPGWQCPAKWAPIRSVAPERKPVLGWYDESSPEVADWQIKWAVEHGIDVFLVDWYWCQDRRWLEHWLHDAYMNARYRDRLKFAIMWANHNPPDTHSREDWRRVTRYWIEHYFPLDEYYRIDGKPAVYIWDPRNIRRDLGGSEGAAELYQMSQKMAREAGYEGITFVAMHDHENPAAAERLHEEGYSTATSYHWWADAKSVADDKKHYPYSLVVDRSREAWEQRAREVDGLDFIPAADTGWDARPWHGPGARVIYGRDPDQWERLLREAKRYLDEHDRTRLVLGPVNEWGEGSYIEPCAEYGFEMYDRLAEIFCPDEEPRANVAPSDVGLGPYDVINGENRTGWTFEEGDAEGWCVKMGLGELSVENGVLTSESGTSDPALLSPALNVRARDWSAVRVRMKIEGPQQSGNHARLFWTTPGSPTSVAGETVPLESDGRFHDYVFEVSENPRWRGTILYLRFDPCATDKTTIHIDTVELIGTADERR